MLIYNKDNYNSEIIIIINEYNNLSYYHYQLSNSNLLICFNHTIIILKINEDNSYNIIHKLKGHLWQIFKSIELKNKLIISCSQDKTIKFWKYGKRKR